MGPRGGCRGRADCAAPAAAAGFRQAGERPSSAALGGSLSSGLGSEPRPHAERRRRGSSGPPLPEGFFGAVSA